MHTERGFTLLEVLIAFVIAALAMGALYSGTISGLDATARLPRNTTRRSRSLAPTWRRLAEARRLPPQETSGADGEGFTWRLRIREASSRQLALSDQDRANDIKPSRAVLYDVVVTESWKVGARVRQVSLATRRFDVRAAEGGDRQQAVLF